jgi:hypothetical protein
LEVVEGFLQVGDEVATLLGFYQNVVDVNLTVTPYLLFEVKLCTPLLCSSHVLQSERHFSDSKNCQKE